MNSKERVLMSLHHLEPDRIPKYIFYTPEIFKKISKILKIDIDKNPYLFDIELGNDLLMTYRGISNIPGVLHSEVIESSNSACNNIFFKDKWGIGYKRVSYGSGENRGSYTEMEYHPLSNIKDYDDYKFPDPLKNEDYQEHLDLVNKYGKDFAVIAAVPATIFEGAWYLRGFNNFFIDMIENQDFAIELMKKVADYHLSVCKKLLKIGADIIWLGDDIGMQKSMLISPDIYRKILKPIYADIIQEIKKINKDTIIAYHSDGYVEPVVNDFIEIGIDVLEAVQPLCMNVSNLKKKFGKNLSFWGGIDVQHVMPFGTAGEVVSEIREKIKILAPGGGYIFCTAHCVQPSDRAVDNVFTYYWAANKYGNYPIKS